MPLQGVDLVMLRSLSELSSADVDDDPLVVLGCGHAFTVCVPAWAAAEC